MKFNEVRTNSVHHNIMLLCNNSLKWKLKYAFLFKLDDSIQENHVGIRW